MSPPQFWDVRVRQSRSNTDRFHRVCLTFNQNHLGSKDDRSSESLTLRVNPDDATSCRVFIWHIDGKLAFEDNHTDFVSETFWRAPGFPCGLVWTRGASTSTLQAAEDTHTLHQYLLNLTFPRSVSENGFLSNATRCLSEIVQVSLSSYRVSSVVPLCVIASCFIQAKVNTFTPFEWVVLPVQPLVFLSLFITIQAVCHSSFNVIRQLAFLSTGNLSWPEMFPYYVVESLIITSKHVVALLSFRCIASFETSNPIFLLSRLAISTEMFTRHRAFSNHGVKSESSIMKRWSKFQNTVWSV